MDLHEHATGPVIVIDVEGSITNHDARAALLARLRGLVEQGYTLILLNVAQVTYVDSVTLGALVHAYTSALRHGATLKLLHATERVRQLLRVTKLDTVLDTIDRDQDRS